MREFPTYEDANSGKVYQFGVKTLVTDALLQKDIETKRRFAKAMGEVLAPRLSKAILDRMLKLKTSSTIELVIERDASWRAFEYIFLFKAAAGVIPDQYVAEAYSSWLVLKWELESWQKKSLWQFITYAWRRWRRQRKIPDIICPSCETVIKKPKHTPLGTKVTCPVCGDKVILCRAGENIKVGGFMSSTEIEEFPNNGQTED